jgi:hypothetical protein
VSRADRISARLRFSRLRREARHKFNTNEQVLRQRNPTLYRPPFAMTAALRKAWRKWMRKFAGRRPWGGVRNANRRVI